jgi:hypothetical protein
MLYMNLPLIPGQGDVRGIFSLFEAIIQGGFSGGLYDKGNS